MNKENYYLSAYQAILAKNLTKALELSLLTDKEMDNHPNEYPTLNYKEIFQNNDPNDVIDSIILSENYKDFLYAMQAGFEPQATEENIEIREANHLNLMMHPLMDYCPHPINTVETLLSISYSTILDKEVVSIALQEVANKSFMIKDILSTIATYSTIDSNKPLSISLIGEQINEHDPAINSNVRGYYFNLYNRLLVTNKNSELNLGTTIHELAHKALTEIFNNDSYPYNDASSRTKYHTAIENTLLNIKQFIKQDFDLDIKLDNRDDTWQMGKTLSSILLPQYLNGEAIQGFISLLQEHHLGLDDQIPWLKGKSPLELALEYSNFELADSLIESGAIIKPPLLHLAAKYNALGCLNWLLSNKQDLDINHKDEDGKTALDYATDPQVIKILISVGASPYFLHEGICNLNSTYQEAKESTTAQTTQLKIIQGLLKIYIHYEKNEEAGEFIVHLPQTIAENLYESKIVEIFEPLAEYWQEIVSPAAEVYQEQYDTSDICLAPLDYADFF